MQTQLTLRPRYRPHKVQMRGSVLFCNIVCFVSDSERERKHVDASGTRRPLACVVADPFVETESAVAGGDYCASDAAKRTPQPFGG